MCHNDLVSIAEALKLNQMFMEQSQGTTPTQPLRSPMIPTCVEEQELKVTQIVTDLASPVGAQPQAGAAQQPSPTSPLSPQQPVILQTQQQPKVITLASPMQPGQIVPIPVNSTNVSLPAGFTLCQLNGEQSTFILLHFKHFVFSIVFVE